MFNYQNKILITKKIFLTVAFVLTILGIILYIPSIEKYFRSIGLIIVHYDLSGLDAPHEKRIIMYWTVFDIIFGAWLSYGLYLVYNFICKKSVNIIANFYKENSLRFNKITVSDSDIDSLKCFFYDICFLFTPFGGFIFMFLMKITRIAIFDNLRYPQLHEYNFKIILIIAGLVGVCYCLLFNLIVGRVGSDILMSIFV